MLIDRIGQRHGRLTVVARAGSARNGDAVWECRCDCGGEVAVSASNLRTGDTRSCGCLKRQAVHGHSRRGRRSSEYLAYLNARQRCMNPRTRGFKYWGGRGIEFRYTSFDEFLADVGPKPSPELTLDRIDNDGHYEPGNCRWATRAVQIANQRPRRPRPACVA